MSSKKAFVFMKHPRPKKAKWRRARPTDVLHDGRAEQQDIAYTDYLQTEHWQIVRQRALDLGYHLCAHCGARYQLNVHHAIYRRLWCEQARDLIVLCWTCHGLEHGIKR